MEAISSRIKLISVLEGREDGSFSEGRPYVYADLLGWICCCWYRMAIAKEMRCIRTQGFIYCVWLRNGVERGVEEVLEIVGKGDVSGDEFFSKD